jgi:macrolide-specific efflux system membrane fusion protein
MATVRVLKADGEVVEQTVKVGINNRVNAEILSGLKKGDEVILSEEGPNIGSKGGRGGMGGRGGRPF